LEEQGVDALFSKKKRRRTLIKDRKNEQPIDELKEALLAKIKHLEMENAYLKKLKALVQEERKLKTARKRK
jgi:transposase